jgi:hypothetical protein
MRFVPAALLRYAKRQRWLPRGWQNRCSMSKHCARTTRAPWFLSDAERERLLRVVKLVLLGWLHRSVVSVECLGKDVPELRHRSCCSQRSKGDRCLERSTADDRASFDLVVANFHADRRLLARKSSRRSVCDWTISMPDSDAGTGPVAGSSRWSGNPKQPSSTPCARGAAE